MPTWVGLNVEDDDATSTPREAARRLTRFTQEVQWSSKAEGGNKAPPTNQEQADCRSAIVACTHL
jgi:hypothetical protein